ncbi:MAG: OmpH family outer membrane protein [Carboxylicivirga sp.]|jgi:outer membrane protein|nr:OmpH family outer membrane protein [Carboxylicivirga sp.]
MKTLKIFVVCVLFAFAGQMKAQDLKFGHINFQKLVQELPQKQEADKTLQSEMTKLQEQLKVMEQDINTKMTVYMSQRDTLPDLIRATKEKEIQDGQQRLQSFSQIAQQSITKKEQELLAPIIQKVQTAIKEVGEEQGLIYIFDISSQVVLYHSEKSIDCEPLVKAKVVGQ